MTAPPFDGPAYRRNVLTTLRERNPAEVEDLFWLVDVPREADDEAAIAERLKAARGFLYKERTRARQAAVAQAVLNEWPRIEATLLRPAGAGRAAPAAGAGRRRGGRPAAAGAREAAGRRPTGAAARSHASLDRAGAPARRPGPRQRPVRVPRPADERDARDARGADREDRARSTAAGGRTASARLTDDLLAHARKLLLEGDPAAYLAGFDDEFRDRVVEALLAGDVEAARAALAAARARAA